MAQELDALCQNKTWILVPPLEGQHAIGCKWVYRIKRKTDGSPEWYRAHLVAKGFHQEEGVNYHDTLAQWSSLLPLESCSFSLFLGVGWFINLTYKMPFFTWPWRACLHGPTSKFCWSHSPLSRVFWSSHCITLNNHLELALKDLGLHYFLGIQVLLLLMVYFTLKLNISRAFITCSNAWHQILLFLWL